MKRSEMIQLIKEDLLNWDNEVRCCDHLKMAEYLLNTMEKAGMLPPFNQSMFKKDWDQHASLDGGNKWEPEDAD